MNRYFFSRFCVFFPLVALACEDTGVDATDGGAVIDSGQLQIDGGDNDPDSGTFDAGQPDASLDDAGGVDAVVVLDGGSMDSGAVDAATPDAATLDAGAADAMADSGLPDAGPNLQSAIDALTESCNLACEQYPTCGFEDVLTRDACITVCDADVISIQNLATASGDAVAAGCANARAARDLCLSGLTCEHFAEYYVDADPAVNPCQTETAAITAACM